MNKKSLAVIIGAAAAAGTIAFTGSNEGMRNTPYQDVGGVWTVCDGQTGVPMHYYTNAQCDAMLGNTLANAASQIAGNTPGFELLPDGVKEATIDFTYNVGFGEYSNSTYRHMLIAKQLPEACDQIPRYKYVAKKDCSIRANNCWGVWERRLAEQKMCKGQ